MGLCELFDQAVRSVPASRPALVIDGRATPYGPLLDRIARLRTLFAAKGLGPGDRIGLLTEDVPVLAAVLWASLRSGIAVINLNVDLSPTERRHALTAAGVTHAIVDRAILDAAPLPPGLAHTVVEPADGGGRGGLIGRLLKPRKGEAAAPAGLLAELAAVTPVDPSPPLLSPPPTPETPGLMLFTSGTTSAPKVVELSHGNLSAQIETFLTVYDYDAGSHILNVLPLHFTDGLLHGPIISLVTGATLFRPRRFAVQDLGTILHGVYRDRITHFIVVPAILSIMDRLHGEFDDAFRTPDFRYIRSSGDRLPEPLWRSVQERFGVRVVNTYGLSETVCEALYCGPAEDRFRMGTVGQPVDCEIRVIDPEGHDVPAGEPGELLIRGGNIMRGYLNRPDLTAEVLKDGWFHTGDLATVDDDGFVRIVGRRKTLIISGGTNIQPQDITDALLVHPGVADAVTFGLPDPVWGERVAVAVVLRDGAGSSVATTDLVEHCRRHLAPHKVPRVIRIMDALPRNPAGKVLLDAVRDAVDADQAVNPLRADATLEERILEIAARVFGCAPSDLRMTSEARTTFGWDSLAHIQLMEATERAFAIILSPRDILGVSRLEHLKAIVAGYLDRDGRAAS